ncbi:MAG: hypothetical protein K8R46_11055, partial [Pirellulales bacterium]|nr:hypothetical protein [Pirellulales bacterium]
CDVHTAVTPWQYCDFDARTPGAATFAATFYAYGEIMLHQKKTWNGPVYSEGPNHWCYCGLTDGNYGQDQGARLNENPWLVDFDLRKLHPLCCNFGMGHPNMFFGRGKGLGSTPEVQEARLDRFLAATLAFGHTGFLVTKGGMTNAVRSYFSLQQVHARYAQEIATDIRYADKHGKLLDTSAAVAGGAFRRSQIATTYSNGLKVVVNGHPTETWKILPPNGWFIIDTKQRKLRAFSALVDGHRADYVDSPAYIYADGRGRFTWFDKAACDGQMIAHKRADGTVEVIPVGKCASFGVSLDGRTAAAVALDKENKPIGPAETRLSRGLVYVTPVPKAFSYILTPGPAAEVTLKCDRKKVVPGESVNILGKTKHVFHVPADAGPGTRLWRQFDGAWIDFTVVPLVNVQISAGDVICLELTLNLSAEVDAEIELADRTKTVKLFPGQKVRVEFPFQRPEKEEVRTVPLKVSAGELVYQHNWRMKAEKTIVPIAAMSKEMETGQCLRKGNEKQFKENSGGCAYRRESTCGGVAKPSIFMHPPYKTGVGYSFAVFKPVELPAGPKAAFRCEVGQGDGSGPGDGVLFRIAVVEPNGDETVVAEKQWNERAWTPLEADLSRWAGKQVRIKLISDVGPADNSACDWACWADMRVESAESVLVFIFATGKMIVTLQPFGIFHHMAFKPPCRRLLNVRINPFSDRRYGNLCS